MTASAIVVGSRGTVLHVHRRTGTWLQPGGHIDPGEAPTDAALRETLEETGLAVRHPDTGPCLIHVDVHDAPRGHVHLDLRYLLLAPDDDPAPAPGESQEARWFSWDEAEAVADESLRNALRAARAAPDTQPASAEGVIRRLLTPVRWRARQVKRVSPTKPPLCTPGGTANNALLVWRMYSLSASVASCCCTGMKPRRGSRWNAMKNRPASS